MELDFDKYKAQQFCDNLACDEYGKIGGNNIRTHSRLHHQVYCNACNQIWVITKGTFFYNLKAPISLILEVLKLLSEGMGLRTVCRSKGVTPDAASAWVQKTAKHVNEITVYLERDMHLTQCQIQRRWSADRDREASDLGYRRRNYRYYSTRRKRTDDHYQLCRKSQWELS